MGTTASGYPYPELTDAPDGAGQIRALAEAVDVDVRGVEAKAAAIVGVQGSGLLGSRDPALPMRAVGGLITLTANAQGLITVPTGLTRYVASFQATQAGVSISSYAHFIVRTDQGTPGQVQLFVGNAQGQGLPGVSVALCWTALGQ